MLTMLVVAVPSPCCVACCVPSEDAVAIVAITFVEWILCLVVVRSGVYCCSPGLSNQGCL